VDLRAVIFYLSHCGRNVGWGVFAKRVLSEMFGCRRAGLIGFWRKLHNEELNFLYSSPNTGSSKKMDGI